VRCARHDDTLRPSSVTNRSNRGNLKGNLKGITATNFRGSLAQLSVVAWHKERSNFTAYMVLIAGFVRIATIIVLAVLSGTTCAGKVPVNELKCKACMLACRVALDLIEPIEMVCREPASPGAVQTDRRSGLPLGVPEVGCEDNVTSSHASETSGYTVIANTCRWLAYDFKLVKRKLSRGYDTGKVEYDYKRERQSSIGALVPHDLSQAQKLAAKPCDKAFTFLDNIARLLDAVQKIGLRTKHASADSNVHMRADVLRRFRESACQSSCRMAHDQRLLRYGGPALDAEHDEL
jgi:hypothetical protein